MHDPRIRIHPIPNSPFARLGMLLATLVLLALGFLVGLFALVVALGLAIVGGLALGMRRWWFRHRRRTGENDLLEVEYRVVHRERDRNL